MVRASRESGLPSGLELSALHALTDFERLAEQRMERATFDYVAGGAADEITLRANVAAWQAWRFRPRVMRDVSYIDTASDWLGRRVSLPVGIGPVAFQHLAHPDAEAATASAASAAGVVFCLSTMSSLSIEEVAAAAVAAGDGPRWFQLYVHRDRSRSEDLVRRAEQAGYSAIVVTADFPVAGRRERDLRSALPYPQAYGNFVPPAATDGLAPVVGAFNDAALRWEDIGWLRGLTTLPILVKGVLTTADASLAVEHGAAGVIVSNHGGRQLDRAVATADVLAEVVDEVAGRAEVYADSGIRRASDALVALSLGARGVFLGRPAVFALAVGGRAGVARALEIIDIEIQTDMALLGVTSVDQLGRDLLRRV